MPSYNSAGKVVALSASPILGICAHCRVCTGTAAVNQSTHGITEKNAREQCVKER